MRLFGRKSKNSASARKVSLSCESLESRDLLSGSPLTSDLRLDQSSPAGIADVNVSLANLPSGGFVAAWYGINDSGQEYIGHRIFDSSGSAVNSEQRMIMSTGAGAFSPNGIALASDNSGNYGIAWRQHVTPLAGRGYDQIEFQKFNSSGSTVGSEVTIASTSDGVGSTPIFDAILSSPALAMESDGDYVVSYLRTEQSLSTLATTTTLWATNSTSSIAQGTNDVGTTPSTAPTAPRIGVADDGTTIVVYETGDRVLHAKKIISNVVTEISIGASGVDNWYDVSVDATANFVVAWQSGGDIDFKRVTSSDTVAALVNVALLTSSGERPHIELSDNGFLAITWEGTASSGASNVYGAVYNSGLGQPVGGPFQINEVEEISTPRRFADISFLKDGNIVAAWTKDASVDVLQGRLFSSLQVTGPAIAGRGVENTYTLTSLDPTPSGGTFTYEIDWNGDGTWDQTISGAPSVKTVTHVFDTAATYTIKFRATDAGIPAVTSSVVQLTTEIQQYNFNGTTGNLTWYGTSGADSVTVDDGGTSTVTIVLNGSETTVVSGVTGNVTVITSGGVDTIAVSASVTHHSTILDGGKDNDTIATFSSLSSTIKGGQGADTLYGGSGNDYIYGEYPSADGFSISASSLSGDTIFGGGGDDHIWGDADGGEGASDSIDGGSGNDTIYGDGTDGNHLANDTIHGGDGNDLIFGDAQGGEGGSDLVYGENGNDTLEGGDSNDTVSGGDGNDILIGGIATHGGADSLDGGSGRDILIGEIWPSTSTTFTSGQDTLIGGNDDDILISGGYYYSVSNPSSSLSALTSIQAEWTSSDSYATRQSSLVASLLKPADPNKRVADDGVVDQVFGQGGDDWFIVDDTQDTTDIISGEILTDLV